MYAIAYVHVYQTKTKRRRQILTGMAWPVASRCIVTVVQCSVHKLDYYFFCSLQARGPALHCAAEYNAKIFGFYQSGKGGRYFFEK